MKRVTHKMTINLLSHPYADVVFGVFLFALCEMVREKGKVQPRPLQRFSFVRVKIRAPLGFIFAIWGGRFVSKNSKITSANTLYCEHKLYKAWQYAKAV
jgi:hypothetical protein